MTLHAAIQQSWNPLAMRWQRHSAGALFVPLIPTFDHDDARWRAFEYAGPPPAQAVAETRAGRTPISDLVRLRDLPPIALTGLVGDDPADWDQFAGWLAGAEATVLLCYVDRPIGAGEPGHLRQIVHGVTESEPLEVSGGTRRVQAHVLTGAQERRRAVRALLGPGGQHLRLTGGLQPAELAEFGPVFGAMSRELDVRYDDLARLVRPDRWLLLRGAAVAPVRSLILLSGRPLLPAIREKAAVHVVADPRHLPGGGAAWRAERGIGDLSPAPAPGTTGELDLADSGVLVLDDLAHFAGLTALVLDRCPILDLSPVSGLRELRSLSVLDVKLDSLAPLRNLPHLEALRLSREPFDGLDLAGLDALRRLDLGDLPLRSLDAVAAALRLTDLRLEPRYAAPLDLAPLGRLRDMRRLAVRARGVTDLAPLRHLDRLTTLDLSGTRPGSLEPLLSLRALTDLSLIGTDSDITPVGGLRRLRRLDLDQNDVPDLEFLTGLSELQELGLSFTDVTDLTPLLALPRLAMVDVTGTDADTTALERRGVRIERRG